MSLYKHQPHPHKPKNVNDVHTEEMQSLNDRIAVFLTRTVGSMPMAYTFVVLAIIGLLAILGILSPLVALLVAWLSQTFIQLVLLPVIMVGQNVLNRKTELQAEEQYNTTVKSFHDIEQIAQHLDTQDKELVRIVELLEARKNTVEAKEQVL
jgi:uncharacterized membrane protein